MPRDPQAGLCLAQARPNISGCKAGSGCVSPPLPHCRRREHRPHACTQHTLGHVTDCVHQGSRSPLTEASRAGGRGLWPSTYGSPHRAWAWAPPAAGVCWGSFLYTQGAHESLVQTAQWAPGPATELRRPSKETLSVPDNSQREALSKRAALKCVQ